MPTQVIVHIWFKIHVPLVILYLWLKLIDFKSMGNNTCEVSLMKVTCISTLLLFIFKFHEILFSGYTDITLDGWMDGWKDRQTAGQTRTK